MKKALCAGFVVLLLLPAALVAAPGEGIGGVDVGIRKRPGGQTAKTLSGVVHTKPEPTKGRSTPSAGDGR